MRILILTLFLAFFISISSHASSQSPEYLAYLPYIVKADPIPGYLNQVDINHITETSRTLVEDFSPRHFDFYHIFINDQCSLGSQTWANHNLIRSSKYISTIYKSYGIPSYKEWLPDYYGSYNVVAEKTGSVYPGIFLDVGAHIDTRDTTPGASDNAAGVAAVVELARVLKDYPNRYSWRFIAFVGEEYGFVGSRYHIQLTQENRQVIKAGLIMDGIAWSEIAPLNMNCIWDYNLSENQRIAQLFDVVRQEYRIDIAWRRCQPGAGWWSDNAAYWKAGIPAVVSVGGLPYTDPNIHKCSDNMQNADLQNAYKTTLENLAVLLKLDAEEYQPATFPPVQIPDPTQLGNPYH